MRAEIAAFAARIAPAGAINGLAQALLRCAAPGVPDLYQGTEFWDLQPGRSRQPPAGGLGARAGRAGRGSAGGALLEHGRTAG